MLLFGLPREDLTHPVVLSEAALTRLMKEPDLWGWVEGNRKGGYACEIEPVIPAERMARGDPSLL